VAEGVASATAQAKAAAGVHRTASP
jgi:hypothetical protein